MTQVGNHEGKRQKVGPGGGYHIYIYIEVHTYSTATRRPTRWLTRQRCNVVQQKFRLNEHPARVRYSKAAGK